MKQYSLLFFFFVINGEQQTQIITIHPSEKPVNVEIKVDFHNENNNDNKNTFTANPSIHNVVTSTAHAVATATATAISKVNTFVSTIIMTIKTDRKKYQKTLFNFLKKNKSTIIKSISLTSYIGLSGYFFLMNRFLYNEKKWHMWKNEFSKEELLLSNHDNIIQSLLITIQQRYFSANTPINYLKPIILFYNDITKEINQLKYYIYISSCINKIYLSLIFPVSEKKTEIAREKKQRLEALQTLFINYIATHNIQSLDNKQTYFNIDPASPGLRCNRCCT